MFFFVQQTSLNIRSTKIPELKIGLVSYDLLLLCVHSLRDWTHFQKAAAWYMATRY